MLKILIVDDERLARVSLEKLLAAYEYVEIVGRAANADEAIQTLNGTEIDVLFLDIQMPEKNGFQLLESLDNCDFEVVFVTAYDEFALKAFEVSAFDYLLKPIDKNRLDKVMKELMTRENQKFDLPKASNKNNQLSPEDKFFIKDGEKCWFVTLSDVFLFESQGNYIQVFFNDQKPLMLKSLNLLEERLDPKKFFRANRKHIVNMEYIEKIETWFNGGLMLHLKNGQEIEVSRRQAAKFKNELSI